MEDQQVLDTIADVRDARERQRLHAQYAREGRTTAFWEALRSALDEQATQKREQGKSLGPARWVARKSGRLLGRAVRNLEQQSVRQDEEATKNGQWG